jgi:hypothetical protein
MLDYSNWITSTEEGWFWIDETGDASGPYTTRAEAEVRLKAYMIYLEDNEEAAQAYLTYMGY